MKRPLAFLIFSVSLNISTSALAQSPALAHWTDDHPAASAAMGDWVKANPDAARRVFFWDRDHPLRAQYFMRWTLEHPDQGLDAFTSAHTDWPVVNLVLNPYRPGVEAFMDWGRAHPGALRVLIAQARGLSWVAFNRIPNLWDSRLQPLDTDAQEPDARPAQ